MIIYYFIIINIIAFITFGIDKYLAINNKYRISEEMLILLSISGGPLGCLVGMYIFHHKTRKVKFKITIPILLIMWMFIIFKLI